MSIISINNFALRQTEDSEYSHFAGTFEELVGLVEAHFAEAKPGKRDGVVLVSLPPERFFSGVVEVTEETELTAKFEARRKGEDAYIQVTAKGVKLPAKNVDIILYSHNELDEDASTDAEWEIVSINARPTEEPEPPTPVAMARNMLELPGGTKAEYTAEEFARSIIYWSTRAMCG